MDWTNIIIAVVAVYGAVISTYTLITQQKKDRPNLNVKVKWGLIPFTNGDVSEPQLFIEALNRGHTNITLSGQGFILPDNKTIVDPIPKSNVKFPHELKAGKGCSIWMDVIETAYKLKSNGYSGKIDLIGFYRDQIDITYKSKPFSFNIDEWCNK